MSFIKTKDGSHLFYKDWGAGQPVVFSHGWPLCADAWDNQMMFLSQRGYRVIAHDRRGHGRSEQTSSGNDMDTYADDLAALMDQLNVKGATLIGHSTGGGEVSRYIGRYGTKRVSRAVLVDAVPPLMVKTDKNPDGIPISVFDEIRAGVLKDRSQYFKDFAVGFYGFNRKGARISQGLIDSFWMMSMQGGIRGIYECVRQFSEQDFHEDLKKFDIPTLVLHGDDDQIVPISIGGMKSSKLIRGAILKVYPGAPHGLAQTTPELLNADLLSFIEAGQVGRAATTQQAPGTLQ